MITLQANKLNLVVGPIGGGKTPLVLNIVNEALQTGLNVVYVTTDVDQHNIKRCVHCLYNEVNFVEIKYSSDEKTPINLVLPPNITVVDSVETIEKLKETIATITNIGKIDLLVLDNINFIKNENDKEYKDRIDWINMVLQEISEKENITILATLSLLKVLDNEPVDFMFKDMGNFISIVRKEKESKEFEITENNDIANNEINFIPL